VLETLGRAGFAERAVNFLQPITAFFSALLPITFTYAIIKHRVMGIRFAIRRGVQYLLAKNILRLIWYLPLFGIAIDIGLHRQEPLQDFLLQKSWWFYLLLFASVSITLRYRKPIEQWVDKKFFRAAYEEELILSDLVEQLQSCDTTDEVARQVATKLDETFRPNGSAVLLKRDSESKFTVGYARDAPFALQFCGEVNSSIESALETQRLPRPFSELISQPGSGSTGSNASLQATLVTPIKAPNGHLMAVLLLGAKKSEERYSTRDRKLLQAVATQTGLILEVITLKERVREEGRVRVEVLAKLDKDSVQLIVECPECGRCYARGEVANCKADGNKLALTLPIERVIDGKYRLERRIGAGGMGAVYEATDLRLSRIVAVKVLTGRLFGNSLALRRFEREARAAARLQHPNIVPVYDFGPLPGEGAFLVMQRVSGRSWRAELERAGSIKIERAAIWFEQLCDAMIAAHASGIIHRDLKPENLLVSTGDSDVEKITVLDFGLAKVNALELAGDTISVESSIVGTLAYMSPEQRLGERVDARSDIYSCAVVVVEALSGCRPPQRGASPQWLHESLVWANATPACARLIDLLDRSLASIPAERVSNMQRFQRELIPLLKECPPLNMARAATADSGEGLTLPM
jgi:tRNA A-37 threonylcarbamoyl transferase component Bud32/GAF domain-containing protein